MFHRLRQLCLVARELDPVVADLIAVFDIEICHHDPDVGMFGLHNALLPIGTSFIEVVAPTQPGTTAERYLDRRQGDGGYMVITDTDDLDRWRAHIDAVGVRVAAPLAIGSYQGLQLHPRDTGGALLEINWTEGNGAIDGPYHPAGPDWRGHVRTGLVTAVTDAELQAADPERLARRWAEILRREVRAVGAGEGEGFAFDLDNASLRFVADSDGRGEGLGGVDLAVTDEAAIRRRAAARGLGVADDHVVVGGVRFYLRPAA
ncbi:hypothetical protein GCM10011505_48650 [Tistrella bauzanensis]|uniref:Glyoxalase-like domain-containing protein n=1 Tax=Tistrella bauzanensis TaxID=657419 RepID=A0ABQ1JA16_9PROT|nr:VOC family protein [Tistrella bauzanensis]GGB62295.1 hypothetical protein GCM10011505_48650 [Tistrella bauzanensis]